MSEQLIHRVIAGFGRSGTTWVQDSMARANSLRTVFEPLHPLFIKGAERFAHRYVAESSDIPELTDHFNRYFRDEYHSLWADYRIIRRLLVPRPRDFLSLKRIRNRAWRFKEAKENFGKYRGQRRNEQRLVKLVRANMMLSWLQNDFGARVVFIIRHPVPVVMSQMRSPRSWDPRSCIELFRSDDSLLKALDGRTRQLLAEDAADVEAYALCWCIENKIALEQSNSSGIPVVHYESLVQNGAPEWRRIARGLDLDTVPDEQLAAEPSQQTWGEHAKDARLLRRHDIWMEKVDQNVAGRIQRVLDMTGMPIYNKDESLPVAPDSVEV